MSLPTTKMPGENVKSRLLESNVAVTSVLSPWSACLLTRNDAKCPSHVPLSLGPVQPPHPPHPPVPWPQTREQMSDSNQAEAVELLAVVFCIFCEYWADPVDAIVQAVHLGGDTNTVAACVGALVGALHGCAPVQTEAEAFPGVVSFGVAGAGVGPYGRYPPASQVFQTTPCPNNTSAMFPSYPLPSVLAVLLCCFRREGVRCL